MSTTKIKKAFEVEIVTQCTVYVDDCGQIENWSAYATLLGNKIFSTKFGDTFKTEQQAIKAIKILLKEVNK